MATAITASMAISMKFKEEYELSGLAAKSYYEEDGIWKGNPIFSPKCQKFFKSLRKKKVNVLTCSNCSICIQMQENRRNWVRYHSLFEL